ncbi:CSMD1, partial [Symbiodinium pilosum]
LQKSLRLQANSWAQNASQRLQSDAWHACFESVSVREANLTAEEDSRGYAVRSDWVSGPNAVFRFVLGCFLDRTCGDYSAFYFMEFDAVPIRPGWLEQFILEAFTYPPAAIRGSRYRGELSRGLIVLCPWPRLFHINGNAVYNISHPWLRFLHQQLEEDASAGRSSVAFDVRMANLTMELWNASEDMPYSADSLLIGNYAQTLLNSSALYERYEGAVNLLVEGEFASGASAGRGFQSPEFVRHGSRSNVFENVNESEITLGVIANSL